MVRVSRIEPDRNTVTSFAIPLTRHFVAEKESLLILSDSFVCVHHNNTSITLPPNSHATHSYIGSNLTSRAHQFDPKRRMPPLPDPSQMSPG